MRPASGDAPVSRADALAARLKLLRQGEEGQDTKTRAQASSQPRQSQGISDDSQEILDDDPLHFSDEQALNDFLQDLADEDFDEDVLETKTDEDLVLPSVPSKFEDEDEDEEDDEQKVADLLKSLGGKVDDGSSKDAKDSKDDPDDSDGDDMGREIRNVMAQAQDEAEATREADADKDDKDDGSLNLPAVPTKLVDLTDPADDIAVRLAALKGLSGRDAGLGQTDAFGLPSAPTFQPGDSWRLSVGHGHGRVGYSDEDQRSWCVVCLEDAVVRCLGCDDDPYCARCWREMHVGPAAGFDERGHKRVPIDKTKH